MKYRKRDCKGIMAKKKGRLSALRIFPFFPDSLQKKLRCARKHIKLLPDQKQVGFYGRRQGAEDETGAFGIHQAREGEGHADTLFDQHRRCRDQVDRQESLISKAFRSG